MNILSIWNHMITKPLSAVCIFERKWLETGHHRWHECVLWYIEFAMGIVRKPTYATYLETGSGDHLTETPNFSQVMSRNRFNSILRILHLTTSISLFQGAARFWPFAQSTTTHRLFRLCIWKEQDNTEMVTILKTPESVYLRAAYSQTSNVLVLCHL